MNGRSRLSCHRRCRHAR